MFTVFSVKFLDTQKHVCFEAGLFAENITLAMEVSKTRAYKLVDEGKYPIRYIVVYNNTVECRYDMLTKELTKW